MRYAPTIEQHWEIWRGGLEPRDAIELAIRILEGDPWSFRSGYLKGRLARYLRQRPLSPAQMQRIPAVLVHCIRVGKRMEFREMCSLARAVDSPGFRAALEALTSEAQEDIAWRGREMLRFCEMNDQGLRRSPVRGR
jgi:hypothetical protein